MSRKQIITFIEGRHLRENSSHRAASFGPACRFTLTLTCFVSAIIPRPISDSFLKSELQHLLRGVVTPRPWLDQRNIYGLVRKLNLVIHPFRSRGLQPIRIVAV